MVIDAWEEGHPLDVEKEFQVLRPVAQLPYPAPEGITEHGGVQQVLGPSV
jgi:hypothetical protein